MVSRKIVLKFPQRLVNRPIVCDLVKKFDLDFNILKAYVTPTEEGLLVMEISGPESAVEGGLDYLLDAGVSVQPLSQDIVRDEDRCIHCGACTSVCPTGALWLDPETMLVNFDNDKCIACEHCIAGCPVRAMIVRF